MRPGTLQSRDDETAEQSSKQGGPIRYVLCYVLNINFTHANSFIDRECFIPDKSTKPWIVSAITKIVGQIGYLPDNIRDKVTNQMHLSDFVEMKQVMFVQIFIWSYIPQRPQENVSPLR